MKSLSSSILVLGLALFSFFVASTVHADWQLSSENLIDGLELKPNNSALPGGICGFNFSPNAGNMICQMLGRPLEPGRTAGVIMAPHSNFVMYINGISCPPGSSTWSNCTTNFFANGLACDPKYAIGVDCTGTEPGPHAIFYTYFQPTSAILNSMSDFVWYFKNQIVTKVNYAGVNPLTRQRIRIIGLTANMTSGIVNCTWYFLDAPDAVSISRDSAEFKFISICNNAFFGTSLNLISWTFLPAPTPAPPQHSLDGWGFKLVGPQAFVGLFEVRYSATGSWGTVCGTGFSIKEGDNACAQMGWLYTSITVLTYQTGGAGLPINMWNLDCTDAIASTGLVHCAWDSPIFNSTPTTCTHNDDVGIDCYSGANPFTESPPGTNAPPIYNGTIIAWNATILKDMASTFDATMGNLLGADATRVIILKIVYGVDHDTVIFRFTDAPAPYPGRDVLDYELANEDRDLLDWMYGIVYLTNNVTDPNQQPPKIQPDFWQVKLVPQTSANMGLVNVRPKNASGNAVPWGTVCTGNMEHFLAATAYCKSAGVSASTYNTGGLIPYYMTKGSGPIYITDVACNTDAYLDNCSVTKCENTGLCPGCTHTQDTGVLCFNQAIAPPEGATTTVAPGPFQTLLYTVLLTSSDYSQLPVKMAAYIPMAYARFQVTFQEDGPGGTTLKFYFSDPVPGEMYAASAATLNTWLQSISAAGRLNLFNMKTLSWATGTITPAPTPIPAGSDSITNFKFRILKLDDTARYDEVGLVQIQRPGTTTWGTMCNNDFSFVEAFAVCQTLGYPTSNPTWRTLAEVVGTAIPVNISNSPIIITNAFCGTISDQDTLATCGITLWETNTFDCTHQQDIVIDCYDTNRKLPAILYEAWLPAFNFSLTTFLGGFEAAFNISRDRVIIDGTPTPRTSPSGMAGWMQVKYYFIDDASVFAPSTNSMPSGLSSGTGGSGTNGGGGGGFGARDAVAQDLQEVDAGPKAALPPPLASSTNTNSNNNNNEQKPKKQVQPGPWVVANANYRLRRKAFAQATTYATYTQPPGSTINYDEFTRAQIAWSGKHWMYAASYQSIEFEMWLFTPSELMNWFGVYEIRRNSTRPNGPISADQSQWTYHLTANLIDGWNETRCKSTAASCYGRVEVQMGTGATWGTVCSVGSDDETALILCRKFNPAINKGLLIPTYNYGQGFIALSEIDCPAVSTNPIIEQCTKKTSDHNIKNNLCTHNTDMGVMCGVKVAPPLARASVFEVTMDFQVFNTSWFPTTFEKFTGLSASRINMWDDKNGLYHEYWNDDGLAAVRFNMTFNSGATGDYTREDLELFFQLHSDWGLYQLYGIIEYINHGPVPLQINATKVTSYVPCNSSSGTCANQTTTRAPTTMFTTKAATTTSIATSAPATTTKTGTTTTTKITTVAPATTTKTGTTTAGPSTTTGTAGPTTTKTGTTTAAPATTTKSGTTTAAPATTTTKTGTTTKTAGPSTATGTAGPTTTKTGTGIATTTGTGIATTTGTGIATTTGTGIATTTGTGIATTGTGIATTTGTGIATTTGTGIATTTATPGSSTITPTTAPGATTTSAPVTTTGTAGPTTTAPTLAPGQTSTTTPVPPPTTTVTSGTGGSTSSASATGSSSSTKPSSSPSSSSTALPSGTTNTKMSTTTNAAGSTTANSGTVTSGPSSAMPTSGLTSFSSSSSASSFTTFTPSTAATTTTTTTQAPIIQYMIDFQVPMSTSSTNFTENLSKLLGAATPYPNHVTKFFTNNNTQVVQITFPDEATQQRAMDIANQNKQNLGFSSAAAVDANSNTAAPPSSNSGSSNLPLIAGAAAGGVLLVIIIAVLVYRSKSSARSSGQNKSGAINLDYNAMMGDTFGNEEHLELHSARESVQV